MIAIVDYGCGNLYSLESSLGSLGIESCITGDENILDAADKIILPGVGAFGDAAQKLKTTGLDRVIKRQAAEGKYILGICLGMQMLFDKSYEYGEHNGLGLISGVVSPFAGDIRRSLKIPHMGWNRLIFDKPDDPIAIACGNDAYVYFVHSYYAKNCDDSLVAHAEYDVNVPAVVNSGTVYGTQFHPEKSGKTGLAILSAFANL